LTSELYPEIHLIEMRLKAKTMKVLVYSHQTKIIVFSVRLSMGRINLSTSI